MDQTLVFMVIISSLWGFGVFDIFSFGAIIEALVETSIA